MKIFAISDLHLSVAGEKPMDIFGDSWANYVDEIKADWHKKVSSEDIVLLCGDLSWAMKFEDVRGAFEMLAMLPGKKIIIRGNHDYWWKSLTLIRNSLPKDIFVLQNDALIINGVIFAGTRGWSVPEGTLQSDEDKKIYDREVIRLGLALESAKGLQKLNNDAKIVCLVHYPPFNSKRQDSGFTALFSQYNVSAVVYGHLHGKGVKCDLIVEKNNIKYYLTSCDQVKNKLVEIIV